MAEQPPTVLVLTELTRRAGEDRRIIVQGIDLPLRHTIVGIIGLFAGAILGMFVLLVFKAAVNVVPILGIVNPVHVWATVVLACELVLFTAVFYRARSGVGFLRSRRDRRQAGNGQFWIGFDPVTVTTASFEVCERGALPMLRDQDPVEELLLS